MMASRFTRAFQLIALALVFSVSQLYVMAAPLKANTDPKSTDKSSVTEPAADAVAPTVTSDSQLTSPKAASERMPLTAGTKTLLSRIFSKGDVQARIAAGNSFVNTKASAGEMFKAPRKALASAPQGDDDGDDDNSARNTWIAVGVLAAVVAIAVIGLRADRNRTDIGVTE